MELGFTSLIGRLLIIPIALSGVCLSMLFGVPMTGAMTTDQTVMTMGVPDDHGMSVVENQDQESQPACCIAVQMEHETKATTLNQRKLPVVSFVADMPKEATIRKFEGAVSVWAPQNPLSPNQPFSLTGIIFKRE